MVAAAVIATSLVSDAHAINSEFGGSASNSASNSGGDSWGSDREQRMSFASKRCKSQAYYKKDAIAFCTKKLGHAATCGGKVRRWICT